LLDLLHEDLKRADKLSKKNKINEEYSTDPQELSEEQQELMASESWKEHLCSNRSIIVDLF
jgi:ubiquitin C-terminal hydrolase